MIGTVTQVARNISQPRGGYLNPRKMDWIQLSDGKELQEKENVHASIVGMVVDYLTRLETEGDAEKAFEISREGARIAQKVTGAEKEEEARSYLENIQGLDERSIVNACKLVTFDVWYRNPIAASLAKTAEQINPDEETVHNIRVMAERCRDFWRENGPIVKSGFTFEPDGYTGRIPAGDGDYLTKDTMWDLKVSKTPPKPQHTLQLLMYWSMGQHSGNPIFAGVKKIGIFNPRLHTVYTYDMTRFDPESLKYIEREIIGYSE